ncbi:hypothetical protein Bca101_038678 [Brassica carinata]
MCKINAHFPFGRLLPPTLATRCYPPVDFTCHVEIPDALMFLGVGMVVFGLEQAVISLQIGIKLVKRCNGLIGKPPATLIQIAVQADKSKLNFYDVSLVDGYNLPVTVTSKPMSSKCTIFGCHRDLKTTCPEELQVVNKEGRVVACKSACLAFDNDRFCCRNAYGTPDKCKRTTYSMLFKEACPSYYSYAYDAPPPLVSCAAKEYIITFCPSSWGHSSTLETEASKDATRVCHHVAHRERSSVSGAGIPHVNSPVAGFRTQVAELTAVSPLPLELEAPSSSTR